MRACTLLLLLAVLLAPAWAQPAGPAVGPSPSAALSPSASPPPSSPAPSPSPSRSAGPAPGDTIVLGRQHLALAEVLGHARSTHPVLLAAQARVRQAQARVRQSLASNVPNVYMSVSQSRTYMDGVEATTADQLSPTMNLAYKIFDGGVRNRTVEKAEQDVLTYEYDWKTRWRELSLTLQERYLDVVLNRALSEVQEDAVRMADDALRYARGLVRGGKKSQIDVLQAQSDLYGARANWTQQLGRLNQSWALLEAAVGAPLNPFAALDDLLAEEVPLPPEVQALNLAFETRSDLKALDNQVEVLRKQVKVNDAGMNPTLQSVLKYGGLGQETPMYQHYSALLDFQVPLNAGNVTESANQVAEAEMVELDERSDALRLEILGNVRGGFVDYNASAERVRITSRQVDEAREAYALAERRYRTGISQYVELTQARTVLNNARMTHEQARSDRRRAAFRLLSQMEQLP